MVNMKKILGILLALCFIGSVTATAVSAAETQRISGNDDNRQIMTVISPSE
jgi:hypothetical protein